MGQKVGRQTPRSTCKENYHLFSSADILDDARNCRCSIFRIGCEFKECSVVGRIRDDRRIMPESNCRYWSAFDTSGGEHRRIDNVDKLFVSVATAPRGSRRNCHTGEVSRVAIELNHSNPILGLIVVETGELIRRNRALPSQSTAVIVRNETDNDDETEVTNTVVVGIDRFESRQ